MSGTIIVEVLVGLVAVSGWYVRPFLGKKGENLATKQDMKDIQDVINASNEKSNAKMMALQKSIDETLAAKVRRVAERDEFQKNFINSSYAFITNIIMLYPQDIFNLLLNTDQGGLELFSYERKLSQEYFSVLRDVNLFSHEVMAGSNLEEIRQMLQQLFTTIYSEISSALHNLAMVLTEQNHYRNALKEFENLLALNLPAEKRQKIESDYIDVQGTLNEVHQKVLTATKDFSIVSQQMSKEWWSSSFKLWGLLSDEIHKTQENAVLLSINDPFVTKPMTPWVPIRSLAHLMARI